MLIEENRIISIGIGKPPSHDQRMDMQGNFIFPGLIDSHIHVFSLGRELNRLQLNKPGSISEMQNLLDNYARTNTHLDWIVGRNWDQDYMEDGRYPNKLDLDLIVSDRPVLLLRGCNHIGVVNSKALEILNISSATPNPDGGSIDKDSFNEPTGILRENALSLVTEHIKITDHETRKQCILSGMQQCLEAGLTSVQTNDPDCWKLYQELDESNQIPIRVSLTIYERELGTDRIPPPNTRLNLLSCDRVKLFADGSLGAQTAALREPYSDTNELGLPRFSQSELNEKVKKITDAGFRIEVHAIGDLATEQVLNAFDYAQIPSNSRPIITHVQVLGEDLVARMQRSGVIANIQPQFVTTDSQWVEKRLGEHSERLKYAYAWKTLLSSGVKLAGGSDSPIELPNPLYGMYAAIFRKDPKNETWRSEERLDFHEALSIYTKGGAYADNKEYELGQLKSGYLADFIVIDKDISSNPSELISANVIEVWVDGKQKYSKDFED